MVNILRRYNGPVEFTVFKSNVCHLVKDMGDIDFMIDVIQTDEIVTLWNMGWRIESLYLLGMLDYLCRIHDIEQCDRYNEFREIKAKELIYPTGVILLSKLTNSEEPKEKALNEAIPEFLKFNIVESKVRDVC